MSREIAVVGMQCVFPGARDYSQLWENVVHGRKAFRKIPNERLNHNYFSDGQDGIYQNQAALIKDYSFDRAKFKISLETFESTDFSHWMALDTASRALKDAKVIMDESLREMTGVYVGNTLTGEHTRSNMMRLRWPYIHELLQKELENEDWPESKKQLFLSDLEAEYKSAFPPMKEDSLAGGLSNTIAGRICNYFNFLGGGYSTDGACSSSLLSVTTAIKDIQIGDINMAVAGGVDISLDPFELVGFSRAGALARTDRMNVFSRNSNGFLPSEGCGFVVLMEAEEAKRRGLKIYAYINGYGISSDGSGGITRPKALTQEMAIRKAYTNGSLDQLKYIEAHGTGTKIGDESELTALSKISEDTSSILRIGALKELIGHSKAASGIAGLIKTILITYKREIPAQSTLSKKHTLFSTNEKLHAEGQPVEIAEAEFTTGVNSFGFGGINVHVSLKNNLEAKSSLTDWTPGYQDGELFLFGGENHESIRTQVEEILEFSERLSIEELADLSNYLHQKLKKNAKKKLAITASTAKQLTERLTTWANLKESTEGFLKGISWSNRRSEQKIGFLFPGQGTSSEVNLSFYENRFSNSILATNSRENQKVDQDDPSDIQPFVVRNSAVSLKILNHFGIEACLGIGHSLGELSALYWAGAYPEKSLYSLSKKRGTIMKEYCTRKGAMYSIETDAEKVLEMINGHNVEIACRNSPLQTIIAGAQKEMEKVVGGQSIYKVQSLKVTHPFHSSLMRDGVQMFKKEIDSFTIGSPIKRVYSPTTTGELTSSDQVKSMMTDQFTQPVNFHEVISKTDDEVTMWLEVGNGTTLSGIVKQISKKPVFAVDLSDSMISTLDLLGYLYVNSTDINPEHLFKDRFFRKFQLPYNPMFISNPCEKHGSNYTIQTQKPDSTNQPVTATGFTTDDPLDLLRSIISDKLDLPKELITPNSRMLDDLHLNSIVVANLISDVSLSCGYYLPGNQLEFSNATVQEIADALEKSDEQQFQTKKSTHHWVDTFEKVWQEVEHENSNSKFDIKWESALRSPISYFEESSLLIVQLMTCTEDEVLLRLQKFASLVKERSPQKVVIIQDEDWASGWIKSFHLEFPSSRVVLLEAGPGDNLEALLEREWDETKRFKHVLYKDLKRYQPFLRQVSVEEATEFIDQDDLVVITGGAKGITAECAFELAKKSSNKTVLLGRSDRGSEGVAELLKRYETANLPCEYYSCDISNRNSLENILGQIEEKHGPINLLIHGAGSNRPISLTEVNESTVQETLGPKVDGLRNLLYHDYSKLKAVVTFGSIIAEAGMNGNADYALANGWMSNELADWSKKTGTRCLNLAWSVWSGTGMGEKLQVLSNLKKQGISSIGIEEGTSIFLKTLNSNAKGTLVVTGKYGDLHTLPLWKPQLPKSRFLANVDLYYPGREIRVDINLNPTEDLYLQHHIIDGVCVLPSVIAIEAMTQATLAVIGFDQPIAFQDIQLLQPIIVPQDGCTISVSVFKKSSEEIFVSVLNPSQEAFIKGQAYNQNDVLPKFKEKASSSSFNASQIYNSILFQTGQFQCLDKFLHLTPYEALASINPTKEPWFSGEWEQKFFTGHPGVLDSMLHMVQACVPHLKLLPHSFGKILFSQPLSITKNCKIFAKENYNDGAIYSYDISLIKPDGSVIVSLTDTQFKVVRRSKDSFPKLTGKLAEISLKRISKESKILADIIVNGADPSHNHRGDGKPILPEGYISKAHCDSVNLTVTSTTEIGCDVEEITERTSETWQQMLGDSIHSLELNEPENIQYTRLWTIKESLRKVGRIDGFNLQLEKELSSGAYVFGSDDFRIVSWIYKDIAKDCYLAIAICSEISMKVEAFKYQHTVSFEETNLVGNVYFSNFIKWQGLCREAFLHQEVGSLRDGDGKSRPLTEWLTSGKLALVTLATECKYFRELKAFDRVNIYLTLKAIEENRIRMKFTYCKVMESSNEDLIAEGEQEIACMERVSTGELKPFKNSIPEELAFALEPYREG